MTRQSMTRRSTLKRAVAFSAKAASLGFVATGIAAGVGGALVIRRMRSSRGLNLAGKVVVITGGSRGLGFALAEECARKGSRLALCARDQKELVSAKQELERRFGAEVFIQTCDVAVQDEVSDFINAVMARYEHIDVLINNAGTISVGPIESQTVTDFQEALDIMYWGVVYPTLAVLPHMRARHEGRIANITSFGGKVAVPHLIPYSAAKFAAVGFSEGMRAELLKNGIRVTTVCPWLMRTGSHLNAYFKGQHRREFTWFSFAATLPFVSMNARRAARKIIAAVNRGEAELILTPQARAVAAMQGISPGMTSDLLGLVNRVLPSGERPSERHLGSESHTPWTRSPLQKLGHDAARSLQQNLSAPGRKPA